MLLASRLEAAPQPDHLESVDLLALAVEEGARVDAQRRGRAGQRAQGEERLLRRALRNLLENARRYGGGEIRVDLEDKAAAGVEIRVTDNGPGVPETPFASASSSRSSACRAMRNVPAASAWAWRWCARSSSATTAASAACDRPKGGGCFVINLPASAAA